MEKHRIRLNKKTHYLALCHGFTLVELLIVMLLITTTLGIFASLSSKPDVSRRLNTAGQLFYGKLREARGVAAMRQSNARLLIHTDERQPELQWHSVTIVAETEPGSGIWEPVGAPEHLPQAIYCVPNDGAYGWSGASSFGGQNMTLEIGVGGWMAGTACWAYEFKPTGRISSLRYDCYLSEGFIDDKHQPRLLNSKNLRGLRVNTYGQVSEVAISPLPQ